ncbi:unnamed protein product [Lampetra planeri]
MVSWGAIAGWPLLVPPLPPPPLLLLLVSLVPCLLISAQEADPRAGAQEGEPCLRAASPRSPRRCAEGLECEPLDAEEPKTGARLWGSRGTRGRGLCVCAALRGVAVCASDGRTYGSVCRLRNEQRRLGAGVGGSLFPIFNGSCETGAPNPESVRDRLNFIANVTERARRAVVHVELIARHLLFDRNVSVSSGSGFLVSEDGLILTNAHVVTHKRDLVAVKVQLTSGDTYEAWPLHVDMHANIAIIKINAQQKLPVLRLARSAELRPGEFVVAIGSPFKLQNTVTTGIVSTAQRGGQELGLEDSDHDYIQTDAMVNYGSAGGPLVNLDGEVVGINTLKVTAGISFAIPSDRIRELLLQRPDTGETKPKKKYIGIRMSTLTSRLIKELRRYGDMPTVSTGVYIHEVIRDSPAYAAGMRDGDVIISINGQEVRDTQSVTDAVRRDDTLSIAVRRASEDHKFTVLPMPMD